MKKFTRMLKNEEAKKNQKWIEIDATDKVFGKLISDIAVYLRGKHKPSFTPHIDCGDYVVVVNAEKVRFSGLKLQQKLYHRHSGYFGSVKSEKLEDLLNNNPAKLFNLATRGMLPKNKLGKQLIKKLKVYAGNEHPHTAQTNSKKSD